MGIDRVMTSGSLGSEMIGTLVQNARGVGSIHILGPCPILSMLNASLGRATTINLISHIGLSGSCIPLFTEGRGKGVISQLVQALSL